MRVLILSKALVVAQYQSKARLLAAKPNLELTVVVPPRWEDERGRLELENKSADGFKLEIAPLRWNGRFHLHWYPTIGPILRRVQPDIIHLDEEPYNLATCHALMSARRVVPEARALFFTWQNIRHSYPPPFSWFESYVHQNSDLAIAGNHEAVEVLRSKGFEKPIRVIPQFGVDEKVFAPVVSSPHARFMVGLSGRLVAEKGGLILLNALAQLQGDWELHIAGSGPERGRLERRARELGVADRVRFSGWVPSAEVPDLLRGLDVLVAPSLTRRTWSEQFGRSLVEAMACGVPVIGSDSGEIPNVIGDAGIVVPEGDVPALARALSQLQADPALRAELAARGRARVIARFTQQQIVDETEQAYRELLGQ